MRVLLSPPTPTLEEGGETGAQEGAYPCPLKTLGLAWGQTECFDGREGKNMVSKGWYGFLTERDQRFKKSAWDVTKGQDWESKEIIIN